MIKRVLFTGGVLLCAAYLGCSGDSGSTGGGGLGTKSQKPYISTDRDSIVDTLCKGALRRETLTVTNLGVEDLNFPASSAVTLSSSNPALVTPVPLPDGGATAPFLLLAPGVLDGDPASSATAPTVTTTLKSLKSGFVALQYTSPDAGIWQATLTINSNADNVTGGVKTVALAILAPDAGTQNCP